MPDLVLLNKNSQIGSPRAIKLESKIDEKMILVFSEKLIFDFIMVLSFKFPASISLDCSLMEGIMVTASEPISVAGIINIGNVMPIIMPNSESASV